MEACLKELANYFKEAKGELQKVSWPSRRQAIRLTIAVIIFSAIVGAFIGAVDYVFRLGLERLILRG